MRYILIALHMSNGSAVDNTDMAKVCTAEYADAMCEPA